MTLRGNVFVQNTLPGNHSQVVALYNDAGLANLTLSLHMLYNTFIGVNTNAALVHVSNANSTRMLTEISDNIIYGTKTPVLVETASAAVVTGANNWIQTNASIGSLTGSVQSASPGFRNLAAQDYTLSNGSPCIGTASGAVLGPAGKEYFQNEVTNRRWRIRNAARDLGAFESTSTNSPVGPYDAIPLPRLGVANSGPNTVLSWPLFAQDFQLLESDFSAPVTWIPAPNDSVTNLAGVSATWPNAGKAAFFRLKK